MDKLTTEQVQEYLHRSYTAVDGLWFMKVEEEHGFDTALGIDVKVWQVLPKIQARMLKQFLKLGDGVESLQKGLMAKLELDKYQYSVDKQEDGFTIHIHSCHWHQLLVKSKRGDLFKKVGSRICTTEFTTFMKEFGDNFQYTQDSQICTGDKGCHFKFTV